MVPESYSHNHRIDVFVKLEKDHEIYLHCYFPFSQVYWGLIMIQNKTALSCYFGNDLVKNNYLLGKAINHCVPFQCNQVPGKYTQDVSGLQF